VTSTRTPEDPGIRGISTSEERTERLGLPSPKLTLPTGDDPQDFGLGESTTA